MDTINCPYQEQKLLGTSEFHTQDTTIADSRRLVDVHIRVKAVDYGAFVGVLTACGLIYGRKS